MSVEQDIIITAAELDAAGFCYSGQFKWFRQHGLDMKKHLAEGTLSSVLLATGDGLAIRAISTVRTRRDG